MAVQGIKIPTADEVLDDIWRKIHKKDPNSLWTKSAEQAMIEFAKLHVEAAIKAAIEEAPMHCTQTIKDCYLLTNIK